MAIDLTRPTPARQDAPFRGLGRSKREAEAYSFPYVEALSDARTTLTDIFTVRTYMTPSARSLYTSTHRSHAPNSTSHPG